MTVDDFTPYLGTPCSLRLHCRGCTGAHVLRGTPRPGKYVGDFVLNGYTFSVEDIEQVWGVEGPPRRRINQFRPWFVRMSGPPSSARPTAVRR
jgi:hypothetical protein